MSKFVFDAVLLELCERHRQPCPSRNVPGETEAERDRRRKMDLQHRLAQREVFLQDVHSAFADSRGLMVSPKPISLANLYHNTRQLEGNPLPPPLLKLEASSLMSVVMRAGPGSGLPNALLLHSSLPLKDALLAAGLLKTAGLRPEKLPFSFLAPVSLHALFIGRAAVRKEQ